MKNRKIRIKTKTKPFFSFFFSFYLFCSLLLLIQIKESGSVSHYPTLKNLFLILTFTKFWFYIYQTHGCHMKKKKKKSTTHRSHDKHKQRLRKKCDRTTFLRRGFTADIIVATKRFSSHIFLFSSLLFFDWVIVFKNWS